MSKSPTKKAERLEEIVVGAGFLLSICLTRYGEDMSNGLYEQITHCLRDCKQVAKNRAAIDKATGAQL